jgi:hypothetical protein
MTSVLEQLVYLGVQDSMQKSAGLRDIGKIPLSTLVGNDINHIKGNINAIKNKGNSMLSNITQKIHGNNPVKAPEVGNYWIGLINRRANIGVSITTTGRKGLLA